MLTEVGEEGGAAASAHAWGDRTFEYFAGQ